jgi:hypothetical protein
MKPNEIWTLPAVGCTNLSNTGNRREPLFAAGYRRIDVLIAEGIQKHQANFDELTSIGPRLVAEGWTICTWHSTTGRTSPTTEAEAVWSAIEPIQALISGHNLNAEDWYEGANRWKTRIYLQHFRSLCNLPLAVWPMGSDAPEYPRDFDYAACVENGCMVYPQQYANLYPGMTIPTGDANLAKAGVPEVNRGTSPGCYGAEIPWDRYAADLKQVNRPVLLYAADLAGFDPQQAAKLVVPYVPPPDEEDEMEVIGKQDGINAFRDWQVNFSKWIDAQNAWADAFTAWSQIPVDDRDEIEIPLPPKAPRIPLRGPNYNPADPNTHPWPEKYFDNTMRKLKDDHDEVVSGA